MEESGVEWTHVRPGMFAGNLLDWADAIRAEGVVKGPYDAARQAPVHELDIAEVAVCRGAASGVRRRLAARSVARTVTDPEPVLPTIPQVLGRPARTVVEWAADHAEDLR